MSEMYLELKDDDGSWRTLPSSKLCGVSIHTGEKAHYVNVTVERAVSSVMSFQATKEESTYSLKYNSRGRAEAAYALVQEAMGVVSATASEGQS